MSAADLAAVQAADVFPFAPNAKDLVLAAYRALCARPAPSDDDDEEEDPAGGGPTTLRCRRLSLRDVTAARLREVKYIESEKEQLFEREWKLSCDTNGDEVCVKLSYEKKTTPYNIECQLALRSPRRTIVAQFNRTTSTEDDQAHSWGYTVFCTLAELGGAAWDAEAVFRVTPAGDEWYTRPTTVDSENAIPFSPERIVVE